MYTITSQFQSNKRRVEDAGLTSSLKAIQVFVFMYAVDGIYSD